MVLAHVDPAIYYSYDRVYRRRRKEFRRAAIAKVREDDRTKRKAWIASRKPFPRQLRRHPLKPQASVLFRFESLQRMRRDLKLPPLPPPPPPPLSPPLPPLPCLSNDKQDQEDFRDWIAAQTPARRKELLTHSRRRRPPPVRPPPPRPPQPPHPPLRPPPKFDDDDDDDELNLSEDDESDASSTAVEIDEDEFLTQ